MPETLNHVDLSVDHVDESAIKLILIEQVDIERTNDPKVVTALVVNQCTDGLEEFLFRKTFSSQDKAVREDAYQKAIQGIKRVADTVLNSESSSLLVHMLLMDVMLDQCNAAIYMPAYQFDFVGFASRFSHLSKEAFDTWYDQFQRMQDAIYWLGSIGILHGNIKLDNMLVNGDPNSGKIVNMVLTGFAKAKYLHPGVYQHKYDYATSRYLMPRENLSFHNALITGYGLDLWALYMSMNENKSFVTLIDYMMNSRLNQKLAAIKQDAIDTAKKGTARVELNEDKIEVVLAQQQEEGIQATGSLPDKKPGFALGGIGFCLLAVCSIATAAFSGGIALFIVFGVFAILSLGSGVISDRCESAESASSIRPLLG